MDHLFHQNHQVGQALDENTSSGPKPILKLHETYRMKVSMMVLRWGFGHYGKDSE
jgi:hypothetical protein